MSTPPKNDRKTWRRSAILDRGPYTGRVTRPSYGKHITRVVKRQVTGGAIRFRPRTVSAIIMLVLHVGDPSACGATSTVARVREPHDNAGRRRGKCRLITLPAISRYKVDGRRALKPPPRARLYLLCTIPHRFRRLSPGDATRPAASHEVGRQPGVSPRRNWRTIESQRPRNTPFHRHYASALSLRIDIPSSPPLPPSFLFIDRFDFSF